MKLLYIILLLFTSFLSITCDRVSENDREEAYRFAEQNYSFDSLQTFFTNLKSYTKQVLIDSGYAANIAEQKADSFVVYNLCWGNDYSDSDVINNLSQSEREILYEDGLSIQGWKDCEPDYNQDTGFDISGNYKYYNGQSVPIIDDTIEISCYLDRYENGQKAEEAIFGYSPKRLQFFDMLSGSE